MKKLIINNLIFIIVVKVLFFLFSIFAYGACPIKYAPIISSLSVFLMLPLFLIGFPILLIINGVKFFRNVSEYKWKALIPLLILLVGTFCPLPVNGVKLGEKRFLARLDEYNSFIEKLYASDMSADSELIRNPENFKNLAYVVLVYENAPSEFIVEFLVGGMGPPPKHTAFLYTSTGSIEEGSRASERWYHQKRINEHWFKVSD